MDLFPAPALVPVPAPARILAPAPAPALVPVAVDYLKNQQIWNN